MLKLTGIYRLVNLLTDKSYIGSASSKNGFMTRWSQHRYTLCKNKHFNRKLQAAWNKYGADAFQFEILLVCDPEDCLFYEQIYLDFYKPEYNISKNVEKSQLGLKRSEEEKRRRSERQRGAGSYFYGKTLSQDHKDKISRNHANVKGINNPYHGKKHSEEVKRKMRIPHPWSRGDKNPQAKLSNDQRDSVLYLRRMGVSQREVAKLFNVSRGCIKGIDRPSYLEMPGIEELRL